MKSHWPVCKKKKKAIGQAYRFSWPARKGAPQIVYLYIAHQPPTRIFVWLVMPRVVVIACTRHMHARGWPTYTARAVPSAPQNLFKKKTQLHKTISVHVCTCTLASDDRVKYMTTHFLDGPKQQQS